MSRKNTRELINANMAQGLKPSGNGSVQALQALRKNEDTGRIVHIPLDFLTPNPNQPRKTFNKAAHEELTASIRDVGVLQPIIVHEDKTDPKHERHIIIAGERRARAAKAAGLEDIPALVRNANDAPEIALIENLQRENLAPLEEAQALAELKEMRGYTDQELAKVVGKSRVSVTETLSLNALPDDLKADLRSNVGAPTFSKRLILQVIRAGSPEKSRALYHAIKRGEYTTREAVRKHTKPTQPGRPPHPRYPYTTKDGWHVLAVAPSKRATRSDAKKALREAANNL